MLSHNKIGKINSSFFCFFFFQEDTVSLVLQIDSFSENTLSNTIPLVTGVVAQQRDDGSGMVDVHFALDDGDGDLMAVRLFLSEDGGMTFPVECLSTTPPPGTSFQSGQNWYLAWNAIVDYPGHQGGYHLQIQADDRQYSPPGSFVLIPAGTFTMGAPIDELGSESNERPQHSVTLTHSLFIQSTEVTNQQFVDIAQWAYDHDPPLVTATTSSLRDALDGSTEELLDLNSGYCEIDFSEGIFTCVNPNHPVKDVTWYGSAAYCDWLSLQEGLLRAYDHSSWQCNGNNPYTASGYRLPTEAEWEYACRAGSTTAFANGSITDTYCNDPVLDEIGWYCGNSGGWSSPVGQKIPNAWDLCDLHGNIYEWCNDWYMDSYYESSPSHDPAGPLSGLRRVMRGGGWDNNAYRCRSAWRCDYYPHFGLKSIGFRPVRSTF